MKAWSAFLAEHPVVVSPTWGMPAFEHGADLGDADELIRDTLRPVIPVNFLGLLEGGVQFNYGRWQSDAFDGLLDQAAAETDLGARADLLRQADQIAMDDSAAIPIYYYVSRNVVSPNVDGFYDNAFDIYRTRWLSKTGG